MSLSLLTAENPSWTQSYHRGHSRLRLGSIFSRASDELVTSIAKFDYQDQIPVVYTFSRDFKLRTWSEISGNNLKSIDVRTSSSNEVALRSPGASQSAVPLPPDTTTSLIRVVPHPNPTPRCSHIVVVFVPTPYSSASPGTFVFYRASNTSHGANDLEYAGEKAASSSSTGSELRGFEIEPPSRSDAGDSWRLWAVWDAKGTGIQVDSIPVNDILQFTTYHVPPTKPDLVIGWQRAAVNYDVENFDTSYFDGLLSLDAPDPANALDNSDIATVFVDHLLHPGRFSATTLNTALEEYIDMLSIASQERINSIPYPSLAARFRAAVGCAVKMETSPQTGAPVVDDYRRKLKQEWLGVWARARELDKQARWPVTTTTMDGGQLLVLDREGGSVPTQEDVAAVLVRLGQLPTEAYEFQSLPDGSLNAIYPSLAPPQARRSLTSLAVAGEDLVTILRKQDLADSTGTALDAFLTTVNSDLAAGPSQPVENLAGGWWEDLVEPSLSEDNLASVQRALSESPNVTSALSSALDLLTSIPSPASGLQTADNWFFAGFGHALLVSAVTSVIVARYQLAQAVLFVSLYHLATSSDSNGDDEESENLFEVLARAQVVYHRYHVLKWLSEQTGAEAVERARARSQIKRLKAKDDVLLGFDSLKMREGGEELVDVDGYDTAYSLLHSLLARILTQPATQSPAAALYDSAAKLLSDQNVVTPEQTDIAPRSPDVLLAYATLADGHAITAYGFTELYPQSSGMAFVRGRALLEVGEMEQGVQCLEAAAAGCRDGSLASILPACTGKDGLGEYYRRVMVIMDDLSWTTSTNDAVIAHFGNLALQTIEHGEPSTRDIWTQVFMAYLRLGQYNDAYAIITSTPFSEIKRDLLGQLISAMCEANEVGQLNSLGFIGFQNDVEERLNFKARNSDPLRSPNYYKVLYSWHISRGDYRSAGEIMYAQGQRYADMYGSGQRADIANQLASLRAQSYLAAINALSLVDKRNAWIVVHDNTDPSAKRRKTVSKYIPSDEFSRGNKPVDIVTLKDMRAEYTSVLCQLRLLDTIPEVVQASTSVTPDMLVGFLTQRGKFDHAQTAASEMDVDMTDLFVAIATRCVELSRHPVPSERDLERGGILSSPTTARLRGPPQALALRYLQTALSRHDGPSTQWKYTSAVADTFFSLNEMKGPWHPPAWLVESELHRDPEGWISRAIKYGWIAEAIAWASEMLRNATPPSLLKPGPDAADIAYNLLDRVLAAAKDEDESVLHAADGLRKEIERRIEETRAL